MTSGVHLVQPLPQSLQSCAQHHVQADLNIFKDIPQPLSPCQCFGTCTAQKCSLICKYTEGTSTICRAECLPVLLSCAGGHMLNPASSTVHQCLQTKDYGATDVPQSSMEHIVPAGGFPYLIRPGKSTALVISSPICSPGLYTRNNVICSSQGHNITNALCGKQMEVI